MSGVASSYFAARKTQCPRWRDLSRRPFNLGRDARRTRIRARVRRGRTRIRSGAAGDAAPTPAAYGLLPWPVASLPDVDPPGMVFMSPDPPGFVIPDEPWSDPPPPNASPF